MLRSTRFSAVVLALAVLACSPGPTEPADDALHVGAPQAGSCSPDDPYAQLAPNVMSATCSFAPQQYPNGTRLNDMPFWSAVLNNIRSFDTENNACDQIYADLKYNVGLRQNNALSWDTYPAFTSGYYGMAGQTYIDLNEWLWNADFSSEITASPEEMIVHEWVHWRFNVQSEASAQTIAEAYSECWGG